jgi:hypothetical protein
MKGGALKATLRANFPLEPLPASPVEGDRPQSIALRGAVHGLTWVEFDGNLVFEYFDALPLFSPQGYHYYLPAYLTYAAENFLPYDNSIIEFLIYSLRPSEEDWSKRFYQERKELFSQPQRKMILHFLDNVIQEPTMSVHHHDAARAVRFWSDSQE